MLEREFWIAVMKAQRDLGLDVPAGAIAAYERVKDSVDLGSIMRARANHPPRRQGAHRGVQRSRRPRARPQGHDQPRSDGKRRAAPGLPLAATDPRQDRRRARAASRDARRDSCATRRSPRAPTTSPPSRPRLGKRIAMFGEEMLGGLPAARCRHRRATRCAD